MGVQPGCGKRGMLRACVGCVVAHLPRPKLVLANCVQNTLTGVPQEVGPVQLSAHVSAADAKTHLFAQCQDVDDVDLLRHENIARQPDLHDT